MTGIRKALTITLMFFFTTFAGCTTKGAYYSKVKDIIKTYNKAETLYNQKRYNKAKHYFRQIIMRYSESPLVEPSVYYLAECYKEEGKYQKAVSFYQTIIKQDQPGVWVNLAKKGIAEIELNQKD